MRRRTLPVLVALILAAASLVAQPTLADPGNGYGQNPHATPTPTQTAPMGISHIVGFEMGPGAVGSNMVVPEAFSASVTGSATVQSTYAHSGAYGLELVNSSVRFQQRAAGGVARNAYQSMRGYLRVRSLQANASNNSIAYIQNASNVTQATLKLNDAGGLQVQVTGGTAVLSTQLMAVDGIFHLVEMDVGWNAGAGIRVFIDGVEWASASDGAISAQPNGNLASSWSDLDLVWDDVVWYDAALGGALGSDYSIGTLLPVSDNAVNPSSSWTGGAGGTTNLWDAVNNVPPGGLASSWTNTSEAKSASSTNPAFYAANMAAYNTLQSNAATIGTILGVQAVVNHAEEIATGTKSGDVWISGNPAQSQPTSTGFGSFNFGDDSGAITAFTAAASTWRTAVGPTSASPAVTLSTQPTVRLDKIDGTTRVAHADFLGLYVMYTLQQPPELTGTPYGLRGQMQMSQLLAQ